MTLLDLQPAPDEDLDPDALIREAAAAVLDRRLWARDLQEAAAGAWTATDEAMHPRWPANTPGGLGGKFMRVGQRFLFGGKEWEIANIVEGRIIAHESSGDQGKVETREFDPAKTAGPNTHLTGATRPKARKITGGGKEGQAPSDVTIVNPYVDQASHDPSLQRPENGKVTEAAWKRFGRLEQLHYIDLQKRYGKHSASGASALIAQAYQDYEAEIQNIVHGGYSAQYDSSSGFTLSLTQIFANFTGGGDALEKARANRERAIELQSRIRDAYAWDLYNRTKSPDVSLFHKDGSNGKHWWQKFIGSKTERIFSGLSQSHHFRKSFFGNTTFATPVSIRHIVMATYVAGPLKGSAKSFTGEKEMAIPYQFKADERSITFDNQSVSGSYLKWLENTTTTPQGGTHLELFIDAVQHGGVLPIPPPAPEINLGGNNAIPPPPEALHELKEFADKLPEISSSVTPEILGATGLPFAHHDEAGNPKAVSALDAGYKPGDFLMGKQGTLYWAGPNATDTTGYGLTIWKLLPDGAGGLKVTDEKFTFDSSHENYKLLANVPPPKIEDTEFDPEGWVFADMKAVPIAKFEVGDKFKVDGDAYEVTAKGSASTTPVKHLESGATGSINSDYQAVKLEPKEGYIPEGQKVHAAKGMSLAYDGKKHVVTAVKKDGTVSIKPSTGGKVIPLAHDDPALEGLFDHEAWELGGATRAGNLQTGELFHGGTGVQTIRPYRVVGNDGTWVYWQNLDNGTEGKFLQKKKVTALQAAAGHGGVGHDIKPQHPTGNVTEDVTPPQKEEPPTPPPPQVDVGAHHGYTKGQTVTIKKMNGETWEAVVEDSGINTYGDPTLKVVGQTKKGPKTYTIKVKSVETPPNEGDTLQKEPEAVTLGTSTVHDMAVDSLPDIGQGGGPGFDAFKSSHGTGGKIKHHRIKEMPEGTVFVDKTGKKFKVQVAGPTPIVTDGWANYTIDGDLRGKAVGGEHLDGPPPPTAADPTVPAKPAEPPVDAPPHTWWNQDEFLPNDGSDGEPVYTLGELPIGSEYPSLAQPGVTITKVSVGMVKKGDDEPVSLAADYVPPAFKLPSGEPSGETTAPQVPEMVQNTDGLSVNDLRPGSFYENGVEMIIQVVAQSESGPVIQAYVHKSGAAPQEKSMHQLTKLEGGHKPELVHLGTGPTPATPDEPPELGSNTAAPYTIAELPLGSLYEGTLGKVWKKLSPTSAELVWAGEGSGWTVGEVIQLNSEDSTTPDNILLPDADNAAYSDMANQAHASFVAADAQEKFPVGMQVLINDGWDDSPGEGYVVGYGNEGDILVSSVPGGHGYAYQPDELEPAEVGADASPPVKASEAQEADFAGLADGDFVEGVNGAVLKVTDNQIQGQGVLAQVTENSANGLWTAGETVTLYAHQIQAGTVQKPATEPTPWDDTPDPVETVALTANLWDKELGTLPPGTIYTVTTAPNAATWEIVGPSAQDGKTEVKIRKGSGSKANVDSKFVPAMLMVPPPKGDTVAALGFGASFKGQEGEDWTIHGVLNNGTVIAKSNDTGALAQHPGTTPVSEWPPSIPTSDAQLVDDMPVGANFQGADATYVKVADTAAGPVVKNLADDSLHGLDPGTEPGSVGVEMDAPEEPELEVIGDLQAGDEFEGADGVPLKVVAMSNLGSAVVGEPDGTGLKQVPAGTPLQSITKPDPMPVVGDLVPEGTETVADDASPVPSGLKAQLGATDETVAQPHKLDGYKSSHGTGGKYKHDWLGDLNPGDHFRDKTGVEYVYVEGVDGSTVLIYRPDTGQWFHTDLKTRVRKL